MEYIVFILALLSAIILSIPFFTKEVEHNPQNTAALVVMWCAIMVSASVIF